MFNVYTYDRKVALAEELKKLKQNYIKEEVARKGIFTFPLPFLTNYQKRNKINL